MTIMLTHTAPLQMELLIWTGFLMFVDGLLYCVTFLPLKLVSIAARVVRDFFAGERRARLSPKQLYAVVQVCVWVCVGVFSLRVGRLSLFVCVCACVYVRMCGWPPLLRDIPPPQARVHSRARGEGFLLWGEARSAVPQAAVRGGPGVWRCVFWCMCVL